MDDDLDLSAWEPPAPPANLADAVLARMLEASGVPALEPELAPRRTWILPAVLGLGVGALAATTLMLVDRRSPSGPSGEGEVAADGARHLVMPVGTADVDPGADVAWHGDTAEQRRGAASWHVDGHLTIGAGGASIDTKNANLRVEVDPMNATDARTIGTSALTASAMVSVMVYSGLVTVSRDGETKTVPAGATYEVGRHDAVAGDLEVQLAEIKRLEKEIGDLKGQIAALETPGALDTNTIQQAMLAAADRFRACAHRASTSATLDPVIEVGADGAVTHVELANTAGDAYRTCTVDVIRGIVFPHSLHGASFHYPIVVSLDHDPFAAPGGAKPTCDADARENEGDNLVALGRFPEAIEKFEAAIACRPSDVRARQRAVFAACQANDAARASRHWEQLPAASRSDELAKGCATAGISFDSTPGKLHVRCAPAAEIFIDGVATGRTTPADLTVAPGKHKVTFKVGDDRYTWAVKVTAGGDATLDKQLQ